MGAASSACIEAPKKEPIDVWSEIPPDKDPRSPKMLLFPTVARKKWPKPKKCFFSPEKLGYGLMRKILAELSQEDLMTCRFVSKSFKVRIALKIPDLSSR